MHCLTSQLWWFPGQDRTIYRPPVHKQAKKSLINSRLLNFSYSTHELLVHQVMVKCEHRNNVCGYLRQISHIICMFCNMFDLEVLPLLIIKCMNMDPLWYLDINNTASQYLKLTQLIVHWLYSMIPHATMFIIVLSMCHAASELENSLISTVGPQLVFFKLIIIIMIISSSTSLISVQAELIGSIIVAWWHLGVILH